MSRIYMSILIDLRGPQLIYKKIIQTFQNLPLFMTLHWKPSYTNVSIYVYTNQVKDFQMKIKLEALQFCSFDVNILTTIQVQH